MSGAIFAMKELMINTEWFFKGVTAGVPLELLAAPCTSTVPFRRRMDGIACNDGSLRGDSAEAKNMVSNGFVDVLLGPHTLASEAQKPREKWD